MFAAADCPRGFVFGWSFEMLTLVKDVDFHFEFGCAYLFLENDIVLGVVE